MFFFFSSHGFLPVVHYWEFPGIPSWGEAVWLQVPFLDHSARLLHWSIFLHLCAFLYGLLSGHHQRNLQTGEPRQTKTSKRIHDCNWSGLISETDIIMTFKHITAAQTQLFCDALVNFLCLRREDRHQRASWLSITICIRTVTLRVCLVTGFVFGRWWKCNKVNLCCFCDVTTSAFILSGFGWVIMYLTEEF